MLHVEEFKATSSEESSELRVTGVVKSVVESELRLIETEF